MTDDEKTKFLQQALNEYLKEMKSLKEIFQDKVKETLRGIDAAKLAEIKKQLGI